MLPSVENPNPQYTCSGMKPVVEHKGVADRAGVFGDDLLVFQQLRFPERPAHVSGNWRIDITGVRCCKSDAKLVQKFSSPGNEGKNRCNSVAEVVQKCCT
jgi:hypothetical protein